MCGQISNPLQKIKLYIQTTQILLNKPSQCALKPSELRSLIIFKIVVIVIKCIFFPTSETILNHQAYALHYILTN